MKFDMGKMDSIGIHNLLCSVIVPRPIAWVSTVSEDGIFNLAPFSMYTMVGGKPTGVGFAISWKRDGEKKDTLKNIERTKEFVVNLVDETLAEAMNVTAVPYPSNVDEFKKAGLTPAKADLVKAPMVAESPISMECRVSQILEFRDSPRKNSFVIGDLLRVHVRDDLFTDGEIQMPRLKAIARLGGEWYCRTRDLFTMPRPPDE